MNKTIAISGYFNPLHVGHIRYIRAAKKLANKLTVIVNNDSQVWLKGSFSFMDQSERLRIIESLRDVDEAVISIDTDRSVCKTLKMLKPDIYAVGGDHRKGEGLKEVTLCKKLGIKLIYGLGGKKIQASSKLINKVKKHD